MDQNHDANDSIEKFDLKVKSKPKYGVILQLHHTVRGRRIRFSSASFDDIHEKLACADNVGNIFILDFADLKFWKLASQGPCTALHFFPNKLDTLIVANKNFNIHFMDIESGSISFTLSGHSAPVKHISYSNSKMNNLLTASNAEAILWELTNYTKYFTLNTYSGAQIQQIMFTPAGDYLVSCFQNDTVQIWRHETMKSVKQIIPSELKHMKSIAFTMNGRAMAMAGLSPTLILFSMDTWKALVSIDLTKYNISGVQLVSFIPQVFDGGSNKILGVLSSDCILYMINVQTLKVIHNICCESSGIRNFIVSPSGKYFLCILQLGEVNVYNTSCVLDLAKSSKDKVNVPSPAHIIPPYKIQSKNDLHTKLEVEKRMRTCMDSVRLRRILMQYGEYPEKFRSVIWRSLLVTPRNKIAYSTLVDKGIHTAFKDIERQFTIHSTITLKSLKRLLSCLAHWCPLFGVLKFLPGFVFPFVKVLHKDPLLLFECVATVLMNQCQLWFEYAPFPPLSILAIIENILAEHDQQLLDHYCELGITSQIYALKILETAFSEVLTCSEWLILWDHIVSNEPSFILMAVVSYNIIQKNAIRRLTTYKQLENFFHKQNPLDKKSFLKKAYYLLNETPEDIHPRRFLNSFISLDKGISYQQFSGYPKATICLKLARKERKKNKTERYTLKDLTTKSQEREIRSRLKNNESDNDSNSELSNDDNFGTEEKLYKNTRREAFQSHGDIVKRSVKDDLIESIMCPATVQLKRSKKVIKSNKREDISEKAESISKKNKKANQNNQLEKAVEKLLFNTSNTETSGT
ncbi:TBC1 domain family member 31 [Pieris brassicae]|uniref:TBC1 domain family member 31 n=1 Tax=Pieris brassicae TaxID=7116 RepID=UPI001E66251D|nr:TBC1 domain family member 31 [Pieris brassicae]